MFRMRFILALFFPALVSAQETTPYPVFESDKLPLALYKAHREAVKHELGPKAFTVVFTNPERNRNNDVDFRFRPDSDFWYLTGFEEPDAALVLAPGGIEVEGRRVTEVLLVNVVDQASETWLGYRMGPVNAMRLLGVEFAMPNSKFGEVLDALKASGAAAAPPLIPPEPSGSIKQWADRLSATGELLPKSSVALRQILAKMRVKKSPEEIGLMRHAAEASAQGHISAIRSARPGMREYEIQAIVEYEFTRRGCEFVAYPSIVGSGPNSTILHYEADRRLMQTGDIVCMDVAGEYHGYAADVTRSYPVSGKFSPAQLTIYNLVRAAQAAGIQQCRNGKSFGAPDAAARRIVGAGLVKLGIIQHADQAGTYFMHGTSHYVGLDVHDSFGGSTLEPGSVLTVEPGIYIKAGSPCDKKWWNIGVRIEDDILVTSGDPDVLSSAAPRDPKQIEALMAHAHSS